MDEAGAPGTDFEAELSRLRLRKQPAGGEYRLLMGGLLLTAIGLTLLVVSFAGVRQASTLQQQVDDLALAPLGLGITAFGAAVWLRHSLTRYLRLWLIRLIFEHRQNTQQFPGR